MTVSQRKQTVKIMQSQQISNVNVITYNGDKVQDKIII